MLVSDFYAAYNHYPGLKQRCWVHLLRDIHDLGQAHPDDTAVTQWADAVKAIYEEAKGFSDTDARRRSAARRRFQKQLLAVCRPYAADEDAPQHTLCKRVERFIKELFVFVAEPYVPSDNNAAGRSLRPLVVSRKISGGTPLGTWHRLCDDSCIPVRHMERTGDQPPHSLPKDPHLSTSEQLPAGGAIDRRPEHMLISMRRLGQSRPVG